MADSLIGWVMELTAWVAPFFIVMSPILSYADQIVSMYRNKTSAGFSLDIPLIMLVASLLRFVLPHSMRFVWTATDPCFPNVEYSTGLKLNTIRVYSFSPY
jgi:hypothetical protein